MGKIDVNKQEKLQKLYDTAFDLFTTQGVIKTSISDIVNRAGIAKGTFYLYFRDKYELEEKLIATKSEALLTHAIQNYEELAYRDFEEFLIRIVDDIIDQLEKNPKLLRFINKNLSWGVLRRSISTTDKDHVSLFYKIASEGPVVYSTPNLLLYTIIEYVSSTCYNLILEHDPVDMESYRPIMNRTLRSIIRSFRQDNTI